MTDEAFGRGFTVLRQMFAAREMSAGTIREYRAAVEHLSDDVWMLTVRRCVATGRFFPTVAEILDAARGVACEVYGVPDAEAAWDSVMRLARRWHPGEGSIRGRIHPAAFDALRDIGGIRAVAIADDGAEIGRLARMFRGAYERTYQAETDALCEMAIPAGMIAIPGAAMERSGE